MMYKVLQNDDYLIYFLWDVKWSVITFYVPIGDKTHKYPFCYILHRSSWSIIYTTVEKFLQTS